MKETLLKLPLQYFAEGGEAGTGEIAPAGVVDTTQGASSTQDDSSTQQQETTGNTETFTKEDVNRIVQERLARERKKLEQVVDNKLSEAQKLSGMTEQQKEEYAVEQRELALQQREAEVARGEVKLKAIEILGEQGLDVSLVEILDLSSAEACKASIDAVAGAFEKAVTARVNDRLRGEAPKAGPTNTQEKDDFLAGFDSV